MSVRTDKDTRAFYDVGRVIKRRLKKYEGSQDEKHKKLFQSYLKIYKFWQAVGFENGFLQGGEIFF